MALQYHMLGPDSQIVSVWYWRDPVSHLPQKMSGPPIPHAGTGQSDSQRVVLEGSGVTFATEDEWPSNTTCWDRTVR